MASEFSYLIVLLTIISPGLLAKEGNHGATKIKAGLSVIPGPHQINAYPSAPLLLNCNVEVTDESLLPINFTWLKNGKAVESKRSFIFPNGSLHLEPHKKSSRQHLHNGVYTCKVITALGNSAITRRVEVDFASIDEKYSHDPVDTKAFQGGSARFWCDIDAKPSPKIQWIKDNINLNSLTQDNDRFTILPSGILQISPVEASDAGLYWCNSRFNLELDKYAEYETSGKASLTVIKDVRPRLPKILAGPKDVDVQEGQSAILECLVDGNPLPKVLWRKRGNNGVSEAVKDGKIYGQSNLLIPVVLLEHDGVYECVVGPAGYENIVSATLNVLVPPKLIEETPSYRMRAASTKSMSCPVIGKPEPSIVWFYNGNPIENLQESTNPKSIDNGLRLILYFIRNADAGYYQCVASNQAGVAISVTLITVENKGNAPDKPRIMAAVATSSSTIRVSVKFSPGTEYGIIQYQMKGISKNKVLDLRSKDLSGTYDYEISDLKPYSNYSVDFQALTQKNGVSDYSDKIYVQTKEDVPTASPSLSITNPNYHTILVSWNPLTLEQSRGKVTIYRVFYKAEGALEELEDVPADQTSFYIRDVKPETTYFIQVLAATDAGFPRRNSAEAMKHVTPAVNASSPPRLTLKYINDTAVRISWQSPGLLSSEDKIIGFSFNITNLSDDSFPQRHFHVNSSVHLKSVSDLTAYDKFEVTLVAVMKSSISGTSSRKFQLANLKMQPEPWHFSVADINAHNISLVWTPVVNGKVDYEVCFSEVEGALPPICHETYETSWIVKNLDPYTQYLFKARAILPNGKEHFSKTLIVMTSEAKPSPPVMVQVEVLKPKVVRLQWLPPQFENGELKSYIIKFTNNEKDSKGETMWTSIVQTAKSYSAVIDDLKFGRYLFTVIAVNSVGKSKPSKNATVVPLCLEELVCSEDKLPGPPSTGEMPWSKKASLPAKAIWIIAAFISSIVLIVIGVIMFCYRRRRRQQHMETSLNSSNTPFFPGNGYISSNHPSGHLRQLNGYARSPHNVGYRPGDINSPHEFAPMLDQIRENKHLDSKGCSDSMKVNSVYHNGGPRAIKPAPAEDLIDTQKDNEHKQEYGNIMAAVIESNDLRKDKVSTLLKDVEEISMSNLDSFVKEGQGGVNEDSVNREQFIDHSSEDSGTECRHAGMLGSREDAFHAHSPASSPGESSLDHQLAWINKNSPAEDIETDFILTAAKPTNSSKSYRKSRGKTSKGGEDVTGLHPERTFCDDDETVYNDRDSGHGGELRGQRVGATNMCDSGHAELTSDGDMPHPPLSGDTHSSNLSSPTTPTPSSPSPPPHSSQPQLPHATGKSTISPHANSQELSNQSRLILRNLRHHYTNLPLPSPPPSPPLHSHLPSSTDSEIAASEAVISLDFKAEGKGQGQVNDGSNIGQSQPKLDIGFSPPQPSPSPPNIA